ncbi:MAG: type IV pili methyl-accepting chemotaxis transducer N-terminal domain-containing protein [Anaerolineae bacterium]|nr:type IV pili methyl-accepting chemotaxis transducer N-terminal domain-containing protein [Anaerolineae bacterium]
MESLRTRLGILFVGFLLLVVGAVGEMVRATDAQTGDALVINLAGRQRMLIQQMTKEALQIGAGNDESHVPALQTSARTFDTTLLAFIHGGQAPYLSDRPVAVSATRNPNIITALEQLQRTWDAFRSNLDVVTTAEPASSEFAVAIRSIERLSPDLLREADDVVKAYEVAAAQKVTRVRWIQALFFISALALLVTGFLFTQRSVIQPLGALGSMAGRVGRGDLSTPIGVKGPREIRSLAHSFDVMRARLQASQAELVTWAKELEARVAQRTKELAALYEVSRDISSRLDIGQILHSVTDKARELLGSEVAFLCLMDDAAQVLHLQATNGPQEAVRGTSVLVPGSVAGRVLAGDSAIQCGARGCTGTCDIMATSFQTSHLAAPLKSGDRVIGALCVGSPHEGAFLADGANTLTKLANSAAIALENARLYQQAERTAALEERHRLAAEMHDGLAQTLSYLDLKTEQVAGLVETGRSEEAVGELSRIRAAIAQASQEARRSIASLREEPQPHRPLADRLAEVVSEFARDGKPQIDLAVKPHSPLLLTPDEAEQVQRAVREALWNVHRHAQAEHVLVCLERREAEGVIVVEDDGRGFDPQTPPADGGAHFGLSIMRARAARLGGQITIHSVLGQGTRVVLSWPVRQEP